jgi:hypothetical protein
LDLIFECQKALFSALQSAITTVTISDEIDDNEDYPYICLEDTRATKKNTHNYKGKEILFIFGIYTKAAPGAGTYQVKTLLSQVCEALDLKIFSLTAPAKMKSCEFQDSNSVNGKEVKAIQAVFKVIAYEQ